MSTEFVVPISPFLARPSLPSHAFILSEAAGPVSSPVPRHARAGRYTRRPRHNVSETCHRQLRQALTPPTQRLLRGPDV